MESIKCACVQFLEDISARILVAVIDCNILKVALVTDRTILMFMSVNETRQPTDTTHSANFSAEV